MRDKARRGDATRAPSPILSRIAHAGVQEIAESAQKVKRIDDLIDDIDKQGVFAGAIDDLAATLRGDSPSPRSAAASASAPASAAAASVSSAFIPASAAASAAAAASASASATAAAALRRPLHVEDHTPKRLAFSVSLSGNTPAKPTPLKAAAAEGTAEAAAAAESAARAAWDEAPAAAAAAASMDLHLKKVAALRARLPHRLRSDHSSCRSFCSSVPVRMISCWHDTRRIMVETAKEGRAQAW